MRTMLLFAGGLAAVAAVFSMISLLIWWVDWAQYGQFELPVVYGTLDGFCVILIYGAIAIAAIALARRES